MRPKANATIIGLVLTGLALGSCSGAGTTGEDGGGGGDAGGGCSTTLSIAGTWQVTGSCDESACGGSPNTPVSLTFTVQQTDTDVTVTDGHGRTYTGTLCGDVLEVSGTYPEDGGTTQEEVTATIAADGSTLSGSSTWTWSNGWNTCSGTCTFAGARTGQSGGRSGRSWILLAHNDLGLEALTMRMGIMPPGATAATPLLVLADGEAREMSVPEGPWEILVELLDDSEAEPFVLASRKVEPLSAGPLLEASRLFGLNQSTVGSYE